MLLLAFLSLILAGAAIGALTWSLALPRTRVAARMEQLGAYGYEAVAPVDADAAVPEQGPLTALARWLGNSLGDRLGG